MTNNLFSFHEDNRSGLDRSYEYLGPPRDDAWYQALQNLLTTIGEAEGWDPYEDCAAAIETVERRLDDLDEAYESGLWANLYFRERGEQDIPRAERDVEVAAEKALGVVQLEGLRVKAQALAAEALAWDKEDARDLHGILQNLEDTVEEINEYGPPRVCPVRVDDYLDIADVPSEDFPGGFDTRLCWVLDKQGRMLCGDGKFSEWEVAPLADFRR